MRKKETMNCNKKDTINGGKKKDTVFSERLHDLFASMPYDRVDLSRRLFGRFPFRALFLITNSLPIHKFSHFGP